MTPRLLALLLGAALALPTLSQESADPEPALDPVAKMLEEARTEIREFSEAGGRERDETHPGREWAERLWRYRQEHPEADETPTATNESIHFLLHADRVQLAIERALALPADDAAWPKVINTLFEAAGLQEDYSIFVERAEEMIQAEDDPEVGARLRFQVAQAHWVEGDVGAAEAVLAELEEGATDPKWAALTATAREEMAASPGRDGDRSERGERDLWQRPTRLMEALRIQPGDRAADVGSGQGYFTLHMARRVGAQGRIYAVDIEELPLEKLSERAEELGLAQIETVLGAADDPRLPEGELQAILVVDAYHEMRDPEPMMAGMAAALAPGGRLAIVDIPAELGKEREEYHERHRLPAEWVIEEAADAGLRLESFDREFTRQHGGRRLYLVVFEKPEPASD